MRHAASKNEKIIRFNNKTGKRFIAKTSRALSAEDWILSNLISHRLRNRIDEPFTCDIAAQFKFYFPETVYYTKKGERSKILPDLDNLVQIYFDCLQQAKIIKNDTQICSLDGTRRLPINGTDYHVEIELTEFEGL